MLGAVRLQGKVAPSVGLEDGRVQIASLIKEQRGQVHLSMPV